MLQLWSQFIHIWKPLLFQKGKSFGVMLITCFLSLSALRINYSILCLLLGQHVTYFSPLKKESSDWIEYSLPPDPKSLSIEEALLRFLPYPSWKTYIYIYTPVLWFHEGNLRLKILLEAKAKYLFCIIFIFLIFFIFLYYIYKADTWHKPTQVVVNSRIQGTYISRKGRHPLIDFAEGGQKI